MTTSVVQAIDVQEVRSQWIVLFPVQGLHLTPAVKNEYRLNDVLFIDRKKLMRSAKGFGVPHEVFRVRSEALFFEMLLKT